jgi:hypothetical protein
VRGPPHKFLPKHPAVSNPPPQPTPSTWLTLYLLTWRRRRRPSSMSPPLLWMPSTTNPASSSITADAPISTGVNVADAATPPPRPTSDTETRPHLFFHPRHRGSQPTRCAVTQRPFWYELPISSSFPTTNLPQCEVSSRAGGTVNVVARSFPCDRAYVAV